MVAVSHAEQNVAKISQTVQTLSISSHCLRFLRGCCFFQEAQYDTEMDKLLATMIDTSDVAGFLEFKSFQDAMDEGLADEALIAATKAVVSAVSPSMSLPAADWDLVATSTLGSSTSTFGSVAPTPIMPLMDQPVPNYYASMVTPVTVSGQNLAEAKDALWKLCEQLNASAAKVSNLYMPLSDLPPPPPPPALGPGSSSNTIVLDFGPLGGSMQASAGTAEGPLLWDDDSDSEGTPLESETATPMVSSFISTVNTNQTTAPA